MQMKNVLWCFTGLRLHLCFPVVRLSDLPIFPSDSTPPACKTARVLLELSSFLRAWDAHGRLSDIFRFKSPVQLEEREDDDGNTGHKQLAMVPWIPPSQHMKSREGSSPTEQIFTPDQGLENQQEMQTTMEEDDIVMMDEDPIQQPHSNSTCTVSANETGTPDAFQWQHLLSAQSPLNPPVMWSC
eukprot:TRINITY_DN3319_c0_g1_i1.p1 TRINITY_DN3319_c0_g1~~TRINITY_DN3319_c0_g1_i1.p1  ORF type:complete len:185 (-),score=22.85 TRINITY_DN3319_c0_g1_i1:137-691(-)